MRAPEYPVLTAACEKQGCKPDQATENITSFIKDRKDCCVLQMYLRMR